MRARRNAYTSKAPLQDPELNRGVSQILERHRNQANQHLSGAGFACHSSHEWPLKLVSRFPSAFAREALSSRFVAKRGTGRKGKHWMFHRTCSLITRRFIDGSGAILKRGKGHSLVCLTIV